MTIYRFLLFPSSAARDDNAGRRSLSNLSWTANVDVFKLYVASCSSTPFLSLLFSYVRRRIVPTPPTSPSCRDERLRRVSFSSITNLGTSRPRPRTRPNLLCLLRFFSLRPLTSSSRPLGVLRTGYTCEARLSLRLPFCLLVTSSSFTCTRSLSYGCPGTSPGATEPQSRGP